MPRDYGPRCKKPVEPVVPDARPNAVRGHRVNGLTAWFHYGLGITIDQVINLLGDPLQTTPTAGGWIDSRRRMAIVPLAGYEQIAAEARGSAVLHADETGWRLNGQTCWLWCFANDQVCCCMIDRPRGSPALQAFFGDAFAGTLVHDFWAPCESIAAEDRQYGLVHLLREFEKVDLSNSSKPRPSFAKTARRLIRDGIRLRRRPDFTPQRYESRIRRIDARPQPRANGKDADGAPVYPDPDARRLAQRMRRHRDHRFTFLDKPEAPFENNLAERAIRPAVILRKNSPSNRSEPGAATQSVLMTLFRTLKLRGPDPIRTVTDALQFYVPTGEIPPLPAKTTANG
ncbi:MAG: IS66 family transposase ISCku7 [Phycisphaerae bacterium]|nr:IS66 family transposase ISCku7 [Phycisphaerae bacterium]